MQNIFKQFILLTFLFSPFGANSSASEKKPIDSDVSYYLHRHYLQLIIDAEELFTATLYNEAIIRYKEIEKALEHGLFLADEAKTAQTLSLIYCRLGQTHFLLNDYPRANSYFERLQSKTAFLPDELKNLEMQATYMHAVSCRNLAQYEGGLEALRRHTLIAEESGKMILPEAFYEMGQNNFMLGKLAIAKEQFLQLSPKPDQIELYYLARLSLARIAIAEAEYSHAEELLAALYLQIPPEQHLHYELAFLRGQTAFQNGSFEKAIGYLQHALPNHKISISAYWISEAMALLGASYLKAAESDLSTPPSTQKAEGFSQAENYLIQAIDARGNEEDYLALAQCYLSKGLLLEEPESLKASDALIKKTAFKSMEAKAQGLLMRAEIASDYKSKEKIFAELTSDKFKDVPQYAQSWHKRGINEYLHGETLATTLPAESKMAFKRSIEKFNSACKYSEKSDPKLAALSTKYLIRAYVQEKSPSSLKEALKVVENLLLPANLIYPAMTEQEEIYYLYGLAACKLAEQENDDKYVGIAEKALWVPVLESKQSSFGGECLNLLASFYAQRGEHAKSEETFLQLLSRYPRSTYAADALYYCAENAEKLEKAPEKIRSYRETLYKCHPTSPYAPTACFHYYSYREYMQGDKEAIKHLKFFLDSFPDSPLTITGNFLMGLDYKRDRKTIEGRSIRKKNHLKAIEAFIDVEKQFTALSKRKVIVDEELPYYLNIRYRALLERALANQEISQESQGTKREIYFQYAEELYKQIFRELDDPQHPLAGPLLKLEPFPKIYEESLYALIGGYQKASNSNVNTAVTLQNVNKLINEALQKYQKNGITKGYYLSRIHYELGILKMELDEHELAKEALMRAEECNTGNYLSSDQKLDLWIQQALCWKALGQMDKAMLIFSKVINDDAISSQRLKAMYLRAEVYEVQGRPELARKQLEATAKKGGEWAHKAKLKLDNEYAY